MSEISRQLLETLDKRVHEQLDMLCAAMHTQSLVQSDIFYSEVNGKSQKQIDVWIKNKTTNRMKEMEHSPGFIQKRLLVYIYRLYERYYERYHQSLLDNDERMPLTEIQYSILMLAASFLDEQFSRERRADICTFLKQDMPQ